MSKPTRRADGRLVKKLRIDGKQIFFYGKTEREINKKISEFYEKKNAPRTFADIAEEWNAEKREKIGYKTWASYQSHIKRACDRFGEDPIDEIRPMQIQSFINHLTLAERTVKTCLCVMSMIFDYAILIDCTKDNPCDRVKIPSALSKKERELPADAEIEKVIKGVNCHFGEFAYLLLYTGMRRGEALALHSDNIDFKNKVIHIVQSVEFVSNRPKLKRPKTKAGYRDIFLIDALIPILKGRKGYIFGGNKLLSEQNFRTAWERYTRESGVTVTPHQLRHAHATLLYKLGIDVKSAQHLLGHSSYQVTMDIYTHISEATKQSDFEKLNKGLPPDIL